MVIPTMEQKMQVWCSNNIQLIRTKHQLSLDERKVVTSCGSSASFLLFLVKSQDPRGKMKFDWTPDIPGDGLAYGVACLSFLGSSLEVWHFVKEGFYWIPNFLAM